jgi:hypothetical protein
VAPLFQLWPRHLTDLALKYNSGPHLPKTVIPYGLSSSIRISASFIPYHNFILNVSLIFCVHGLTLFIFGLTPILTFVFIPDFLPLLPDLTSTQNSISAIATHLLLNFTLPLLFFHLLASITPPTRKYSVFSFSIHYIWLRVSFLTAFSIYLFHSHSSLLLFACHTSLEVQVSFLFFCFMSHPPSNSTIARHPLYFAVYEPHSSSHFWSHSLILQYFKYFNPMQVVPSYLIYSVFARFFICDSYLICTTNLFHSFLTFELFW